MESLWQDIRFGLRMLWKTPGFTAVAIAALALGIGANTAMFSVVNAVVLRPLPFPEPNRLMAIYHEYPGIGIHHVSVSPITLDFYLKNQKSLESMGGFGGWGAPTNLTGSGEPQRLRTIGVTGGFFRALGVGAITGRTITENDDQPGKNRVVVLGNGLWRRQFGADPAMVGKTITLDGNNYDVIGIMPASFDYPSKSDLWVPMGMTAEQWQRGVEFMEVVGRLKPGVSAQQSVAEMKQLTAAVRQANPRDFEGDTSGWRVDAEPLSEYIRGDLRPALLVLLAAVGCVLLIACVNIANLLLARATARQREIATRVAIGATRVRMIRQLLTESMVLSLAGGVVGLVLGYLGVTVLLTLLPMELPSFMHVAVDPSVLAFTLVLALITGILFGLAPAWQISSPQLVESLKEGRSALEASHHRLRDMLVVGEMALAVLLLVGAGLMIRSFVKYQRARIGFDPDHVLTFFMALPEQKYADEARRRVAMQQMEQRMQSLPDVEAAGMVSTFPLTGTGWMNSYQIQGKQIRPGPHSYFATATPGYFKALRIQLIQGRFFQESDGEGAPLVAIIDDKAARMYFGDENPVGHQISFDSDRATKQPRSREIVGVVGSVKHKSTISEDTKGQVYLPFTQVTPPFGGFAIRTTGNPSALVAAARAKVREVDPELPIFEVKTMDKLVDDNLAQPRFNTVLLGIFGGLALVLAAIGIYGVLSYLVTQRTHEIGLRMALGARPDDVLMMVIKHALKLAGIGVVIGVLAALLSTKALASMLFQVSRTDPLTYMAIVTILGGVALLASYVPARRAANVDPMVALRNG